MPNFIRPFFEIAFFRRSPDSLPSSETYVYQVLLIAVLVSCGFVYILERLSVRYLIFYAISIVCFAAFIYVLLTAVNKIERFKQTFVAGMGVDIVINVMMLPAAYSTIAFPEGSVAFNLGVVATLLSLVWAMGVLAFILRAATELKPVECIILAVSINMFMVILSNYI